MRRSAAAIAVLGGSIFAIVVVALLFLVPEADPIRTGISSYALESPPAVIGGALAAVGVAGMALAVAWWRPAVPGGRWGPVLLVVWGLSSIVAGLFPLDAPGVAPTVSGRIHEVAGMNFLVVVPAAILVAMAARRSQSAGAWRKATSLLAWLLALSAVLLFAFNGPLADLEAGGLVQRVYWLVLVAWLLVAAGGVLTAEGA